ncbi:DEAD-box ATP-dependent RNA helicase [Linnemannia exigua]|uniref:DEAD-box ATP-dependent RNA helicase n=1 Tax=Linnemannia exigua TaxID=604196 RepID=A0AAD4DGV4_9FUNG|nr:DEAD-box ATP-dependent RNA helicase [Linnemannia exigua]
MSRNNHRIEPLCYTSDGVYLYAIAQGYITKGGYSKPELFVVRSNPQPASLDDLTWEVIESSPVYPFVDIQRIVFAHTALCGWNPTSSSFGMMLNGLRLGSYIDRLGVSLSSRLLSSTFSSKNPHIGDSTAQGRSLLLPISNQAAHQGNSSHPLHFSSSWVQVDLESHTKEMLFTFYPKMDAFYQPQIRWSMDKFGTNEPPSTVYRLLASSNNNMYALGSSDNGLVISVFPQNISSVAPYTTRPAQEFIKTNVTDMKSYKVFKFDGTKLQQLPPIPLEIISTHTSPNAPFLIPVPNKDTTQPATWGIVSLGDGESQLYNLTGKTTINNHTLYQPKIFSTDRPYTFKPSTNTEEPSFNSIPKTTTFGMLLGVAAFGLLISIYGIFVYRRDRRNNALNALQGGVNRVAYGDDACDSLPRYTPREHTADHSGFNEGLFHGRVTRPPSYKTTLSVNGLSRSATRAITMLASPTESLSELDLVGADEEGVQPLDSGTIAAAAALATAAVVPGAESAALEMSDITVVPPTTTSESASTDAPVDSITTTPVESDTKQQQQQQQTGHFLRLLSDIDDYVHRVSRAGRARDTGIATAFLHHGDKGVIRDLLELLKEASHDIPGRLETLARRGSYNSGSPG